MGCIAAFIHVCCAPKRWVSIGLLAVYGAVCWAAGALAGFACYFALLHSPIHLTRWRHALNQQGYAPILMLSFIVMSAIAGAVWMSASALRPHSQPSIKQPFDTHLSRWLR